MKFRFRLIFCLLLAVYCPDTKAQTAGNWFFSFPAIHEIDIQFYESNFWDSLTHYKSIDDQTGIEHYLAATIRVDTLLIDSVGVRLRGNSSYGHPGNKKPIQLDFNEFVSGQKLDGLKKLNLNNSFLDPTQIREKLFLDVLNKMGLPSPRSTYVRVYFNGTYIGLYKGIETVNKEFLDRRFGNSDGNLYRCEPDMPLSWEGNTQSAYYDNCELKTNESANDWSDLIQFLNVLNNNPITNIPSALPQVFNMQDYIKAWAANNVFGNLDSYMYLAHNYYLYQNTSTQKMEWITWDVSLAFGVYAILVVPNSVDFDIRYLPQNARTSRPLNYFILENSILEKMYFNAVCDIFYNEFDPVKLYPKIDSIAAVIRSSVYAEPVTNQMFSPQQFEDNLERTQVNYQLIGRIPGLKQFIAERRRNIEKQFCEYNWSCSKGERIPKTDEGFMQIYPNPVMEKVTIEIAAEEESVSTSIRISDLSGRVIARYYPEYNASDLNFQMDVSNLAQGVYVVSLASGCRNATGKFVVVK